MVEISKTDSISLTYADIDDAAKILDGVANVTPVLTSRQADRHTGASLFFKCENFQRVGAFKFRGAFNAISCLNDNQKKNGVVAFSSGNHAQAVALASNLLGVKATIVMPSDAPVIKLSATREYGAEVVLYDRLTESREEIASKISSDSGATLIPPFNNPKVIAGQGTAAKELIEEVGHLDYLFVCVGGGGLISGSAVAARHLSPQCKVIGVEPEKGDDARQSMNSGKIVKIEVPDTIADGAQTQAIGTLILPILQNYVSEIITVTDNQLKEQMRWFAERMKIVVEPTGCLAAAAAMSKAIDLSGKRVGIIISGGNVDMDFFGQCVATDKRN